MLIIIIITNITSIVTIEPVHEPAHQREEALEAEVPILGMCVCVYLYVHAHMYTYNKLNMYMYNIMYIDI